MPSFSLINNDRDTDWSANSCSVCVCDGRGSVGQTRIIQQE